MERERKGEGPQNCSVLGGWGCFLCRCSPILSPENVTLPLGGSAPRRDSSVWPHLPRCSVARSRGAWEASHCTLSAHQHPSHKTMDLIFKPHNSISFGKLPRILNDIHASMEGSRETWMYTYRKSQKVHLRWQFFKKSKKEKETMNIWQKEGLQTIWLKSKCKLHAV